MKLQHDGVKMYKEMVEFFFPGTYPEVHRARQDKLQVKEQGSVVKELPIVDEGETVDLPLEVIIAHHMMNQDQVTIARLKRDVSSLNERILNCQRNQQQLREKFGIGIA